MNKNLIVLQEGRKDCGSACLLSIIRYYGGNISISKLEDITETTKDGTNFLKLKNASYKLGFNAIGYKVDDFNKLYEIKCPYIVQIVNDNYSHFVVVYKIKNNKLLIMDPAKGKVVMQKEQFVRIWTGHIMMFAPYKSPIIYKEEKYLTKLIIDIISDNKKLIIDILTLSFIYTILSCIITYYFQIIIDSSVNNNYYNLVIITIFFILITLYKCVTSYFRNELLIYLNQKLDLKLIINTFNKLLLLPYNYYKNKTTGEVISRINDIANIKTTISKIIITVFLDMLICLVGGIILYNISNKLFMFLIVITLFYLLVFIVFKKLFKRLVNINQVNNSKISSFLVETISGFETIKGLNLEKNISNKFENIYVKSLKDNLIYEKVTNCELFIKELINGLTIIILIFLGIKLVMENNLKLTELITFNTLYIYYLEPIKNIINLNSEYQYMKNSLKRANNLFEVETISNNTTSLELNGNIKVMNLKFKYANKLILDNVNFEIEDGEKVLLLGSSGSGKSTILKLLFKYYNIERNYISLNNYDINDYTVKDIRNNITYISQNEILFNDTIKNNIILDRNICEDRFLKISKLIYVEDIIKDEIFGYDKLLEENGINLSGGQRQRIILARALLKNSKIILIDEGLNEIDINLERKILKNIFNEFKNETFIIVSHRLNNMDLFDKVLKLNNKNVEVISKCKENI